MRKRQYTLLTVLICILLFVFGCGSRLSSSAQKLNCNVMSVEHSMSGDTYVCNNSSDIFIYEQGSVYRLDDGRNELIFSEKYPKAVTCTDNYIFYSVTTAEGVLYRYSFQTKQSELLMSKKIVDLKANEKDVFVVYEDGQKGTRTDHAEDYYYQVILYKNGTDEVK